MRHRLTAKADGNSKPLSLKLNAPALDSTVTGINEVDGTYIGGNETNKQEKKLNSGGQRTVGKQAILGMRAQVGRIETMLVEFATKVELKGKFCNNVEL